MKSLTKYLASGALALALSAGAATAATISIASLADTTAMLGSLSATSVVLPSGVTSSNLKKVSNSIGGQFRSPFEALGVGNYESIEYFTVGSPVPNNINPATLTFGKDQTSFSMLWGSIDTWNVLQFFNNNVLTFTATGNVNVNPATQIDAYFVSIGSILFDKVVFTSNTAAFEVSNIQTTPVPVPAAGLLLIGALGGLAFLRRRRTV